MENNKKIMETPFSLPSEDINFLTEQAELWKQNQDRKNRIQISKTVSKKYGKDSEQYKYFDKIKMKNVSVNNDGHRREYNFVSTEGKERDIFNKVLIEYLDKYLMGRNDFTSEQNEKLWSFGSKNSGGKLPNYFWMRMSKDVLPKIIEKGCPNRHAWLLGVSIIKQHETEFIHMLKTVSFKDWNHISNTIIQFLNKYMIIAYSDLIKQAKQEIIMKRKKEEELRIRESISALQDNPEEDFDPFEYKLQKERGKATQSQNPVWDTSGLI